MKYSKLNVNFQNAKKKKEKNYFVSDITASEDVAKNSQLRREYSSYEVDVLTNSPKILRIT